MTKQSNELHLAPTLSVPRAIAARTVFIAGTKGSGKTYTGGVMAEEMLAAGVQLVILDPLGVWWGLRHDASGGAGGYPIVILGGEHGDASLLPTAGEAVAEYVVRSGQSVILDMSGFGANAEQDRFVTDLLHKLFRLKGADKSAVHLIIDEADMFVPQQALSKSEIPLLGATKTIVTKGRSRGLSMTMITQRPQSISKAAIEEADVIFCHRMQGLRAVKAMGAWTDLYATKEQAAEFFESLPKLGDGECWVWSPSFLKIFGRHQIRKKRTFDSSRTPEPGAEAKRQAGHGAAVDLEKLTAEIRASAEEAKASDPRELKRVVASLRAELDRLKSAKPAAVKVETKVVERAVLKDGQIEKLNGVVAKLQVILEKAGDQYQVAVGLRDGLAVAIRSVGANGQAVAESGKNRQMSDTHYRSDGAWVPLPAAAIAANENRSNPARTPSLTLPRSTGRGDQSAKPQAGANGDGAVVGKSGLRRIMVALAQAPEGLNDRQLYVRADLSPGGTFDTYLSRARTAGWIVGDPSRRQLTQEGLGALGAFDPLPQGRELLRHWVGKLAGSGSARMLTALAEAHPSALTKDELIDAAKMSAGGTFDTYLSRLRAWGLVEGSKEIKASDDLFD